MNYWITTHWPPLAKERPQPSSPLPEQYYWVYLQDGHQNAGREVSPGDHVFIYQYKTGRSLKSGDKHVPGQRGIIALVSALTPILEKPDEPPDKFKDGTVQWMKWQAETQLKELGLCSHDNVCRILGYSEDYTLRGFGYMGSGLKKLTREEFKSLLDCFRARA